MCFQWLLVQKCSFFRTGANLNPADFYDFFFNYYYRNGFWIPVLAILWWPKGRGYLTWTVESSHRAVVTCLPPGRAPLLPLHRCRLPTVQLPLLLLLCQCLPHSFPLPNLLKLPAPTPPAPLRGKGHKACRWTASVKSAVGSVGTSNENTPFRRLR